MFQYLLISKYIIQHIITYSLYCSPLKRKSTHNTVPKATYPYNLPSIPLTPKKRTWAVYI